MPSPMMSLKFYSSCDDFRLKKNPIRPLESHKSGKNGANGSDYDIFIVKKAKGLLGQGSMTLGYDNQVRILLSLDLFTNNNYNFVIIGL